MERIQLKHMKPQDNILSLTLCPYDFSRFFCRQLIFFLQNQLFRNILSLIIEECGQSVKQFGFRPGPTFCRPGLVQNCLQKFSAIKI